jgi:hypothetical protein
VRPRAIGASGVSKDQQLARCGVQAAPDATPPLVVRVGRESRCIVRCSDDDEPVATRHMVDTVGNCYTISVAGKVVHVDIDWRLAPLPTLILEQSNQFSLLGIHADDRLTALRELVSRVAAAHDTSEAALSSRMTAK